jgi:hypothetical protein
MFSCIARELTQHFRDLFHARTSPHVIQSQCAIDARHCLMIRLICPRELFDGVSQVVDVVDIAVCDFKEADEVWTALKGHSSLCRMSRWQAAQSQSFRDKCRFVHAVAA